MKLLEGKTAIVTGAARGIGEAVALKFAEHGANVAFTYVSESSAEKAMALDDATFFPSIVWSYFPDIFTCLGAELNWHQLMKSILVRI